MNPFFIDFFVAKLGFALSDSLCLAEMGFESLDTSKKMGDAADSKRRLVAVSFCQRVTPKRQSKSHFSQNPPLRRNSHNRRHCLTWTYYARIALTTEEPVLTHNKHTRRGADFQNNAKTKPITRKKQLLLLRNTKYFVNFISTPFFVFKKSMKNEFIDAKLRFALST